MSFSEKPHQSIDLTTLLKGNNESVTFKEDQSNTEFQMLENNILKQSGTDNILKDKIPVSNILDYVQPPEEDNRFEFEDLHRKSPTNSSDENILDKAVWMTDLSGGLSMYKKASFNSEFSQLNDNKQEEEDKKE